MDTARVRDEGADRGSAVERAEEFAAEHDAIAADFSLEQDEHPDIDPGQSPDRAEGLLGGLRRSPVRAVAGRLRAEARIASWPLRARWRRDAQLSPRAIVRDPRLVEIGRRVLLGREAELWAFCERPGGGPGIRLAERADIRSHALLHAYGGHIDVGVHSCVNHFCFINAAGGVTIGDEVMIGTGTAILSSEHGIALSGTPMTRQPSRVAPVVVEDNVYIGANAVIQAGVKIGTGAVVASGAVVRQDVRPGDIVGGVPARVIRRREDR